MSPHLDGKKLCPVGRCFLNMWLQLITSIRVFVLECIYKVCLKELYSSKIEIFGILIPFLW